MTDRTVELLSTCAKNAIKNYANTLAIPASLHKKGRTNAGNPTNGSNTSERIAEDSEDLGKAAEEDAKAYEELLDDEDMPEECKKIVRQKLKKIKKMKDDDFKKSLVKRLLKCGDIEVN